MGETIELFDTSCDEVNQNSMSKVKYEAMYTRRITQKSKNFQDGFAEIEETGDSRFTVTLMDDTGSTITKMSVSELPPLDGTSFRFGELLVEIYGNNSTTPVVVAPPPKLGFRAPKTVSVPQPVPRSVPSREKIEQHIEQVKTKSSTIRSVPRTIEEIITLFETAGTEKKHDRKKIQTNLTDFLE